MLFLVQISMQMHNVRLQFLIVSQVALNSMEIGMKVGHVYTSAVLATGIIFSMVQSASAQDQLDRTTLPIQ
jgi:hypothetical protein